MVYSLEVLNSDSNFVSVQGAVSTVNKAVTIYFNGSGIHDVTGPTPFVDLTTSVERNEAGEPLVYTNRITLTGKIVRGVKPKEISYGSGINAVMSGVSGLKQIFSNNTCGLFEIKCKSAPNQAESSLFSAQGVRFISLDINKSSDNWIYTADYTAVLEYSEPAYSGWYVKQYSDTWNIEPLEEYIYTNDKINDVIQKQEYYNPKLLPTKPSITLGQPPSTQTNTGGTAVGSSNVGYINIPQFKISRTVSAVGIPSGTGLCGTIISNTINFDRYPPLAVSAFYNAKQWVEERSSSVFAFNKNKSSSPPSAGGIWSPLDNGYFYNHLRSVNFDIHSAKYEITDTWLAMPTGISFVEDYSLEFSTDDKYIHTVRVQGEIRGLNMSSPAITGKPYVSGSGNPLTLNLSIGTGLMKHTWDSAPTIPEISLASTNKELTISKYTNALSGWLTDVKPYLYRRACMAMNSKDREEGYIPPLSNPPRPPNNPVYSRHSPLNIIPLSTSESHNPKKGTITYTYEFNNKFTIINGVLYESISIDENGPVDVIGEAFVLGRALGPVLQNLGTKTSTKKNVTIEVGVVPPSSMAGFFMQSDQCPLWTGGTVYRTITGIIEGLKPFGDRQANIFGSTFARANAQGQVYVTSDNQTWDPTNGRYVKTIGWVYQQCSNNKNYLDY